MTAVQMTLENDTSGCVSWTVVFAPSILRSRKLSLVTFVIIALE